TARDATFASTKIFTAMNSPAKARPARRFGPASSKAPGSRWTLPNTNNRCLPSEPHALLHGPGGSSEEASCHHAGEVRKLVLPSRNRRKNAFLREDGCVGTDHGPAVCLGGSPGRGP